LIHFYKSHLNMAGLTVRGGLPLLKLPSGSLAGANIAAQPYSSEVKPRLNLAAMKRGKGGRSSFSGDVVTVFGSSGFVGRGVANRLGKNGSQIIFPYRGDHYKMMRLKVVGDLGQVLFCPFELMNEDSIRHAVSRSNIVINLIGRGIETKNFSYKDVNVTGPAKIAKICREMGVKRLVHMSSINARAEPETAFMSKGSAWLRTKYEGELAVREEFPDATIFRAADMYGQKDTFINQMFDGSRRVGSQIPLFMKGHYTVKQPVFWSDVVSGIMNSLYDPNAIGQTYEAVGPDRFTMHELTRYMFEQSNRTEEEWNLQITELMLEPRVFAKAFLTGIIPFGGVSFFNQLNIDCLERMSISDESEGLPNLTDLGVKLTRVADKMPSELLPRNRFGYLVIDDLTDMPKVNPPTTIRFDEERALQMQRGKGFLNFLPLQ
jgi:NADH dehydrogenase (ubiquinone) 1 alpha subcomplex subunit 9